MEFLDDLLSEPESEDEAESQAQQRGQTPTGDQGPDEALSSAAESQGGTADDEAWAELLEGVDFDDEEEDPDRKRARGGKGGLTAAQRITLGVLGVVVVGLWGVIIVLFSRSLSASGSDAPVTVVSYTDITPEAPASPTPTFTPDPESAPSDPTNTPPPTLTPSATPPVFTEFDQRIEANPDDIELYLQRGRKYIELGAYVAAREDFARARALDDERPEVYIGEGWACYYSGRWQCAEEAFGTAIAFNEDIGEAHFGLGKVTYYQGRYEDAAREFDWAAAIDPTDAAAESWLGIAAAKMGDETEAFGAVTRALSETTELPVTYVAQSWARRIQVPPDIDGAQADLLYARELAPNSFLTLNALARFYVDHRPERLAEAEQLAAYAGNWATNDVQRAVALQTLGRVYLEQDRQTDAERVFIQAIDLVSKEGDIRLVGLEADLNAARD